MVIRLPSITGNNFLDSKDKVHIISILKGVPMQDGEYGQEAYAEGMSNVAVDTRKHLEVGRSEDGTETDTHGRPAIIKDSNEAVLNRTEGRQEIQGEEIGGGY